MFFEGRLKSKRLTPIFPAAAKVEKIESLIDNGGMRCCDVAFSMIAGHYIIVLRDKALARIENVRIGVDSWKVFDNLCSNPVNGRL